MTSGQLMKLNVLQVYVIVPAFVVVRASQINAHGAKIR